MTNSNPELLFSVIVPTYNRLNEIQELLASLEKQSLPKSLFEVLIVDDGSTDETIPYLERFLEKGALNLRYFRQDHQGPGEARNYGMREAKGKYFIFVDSDCIADPLWLEAYATAVSDEEVAGFGGPDGVLSDFSPLQKAIDYAMTSFITTGGIRGHSKKKISKYYPRSFNMGVHRDVVAKIGGMNKLRHGQDIEFSHRILQTGGKVIKVAGAVVYHKRRTSISKFYKQVFNWGVARINLYKIDKGMLEPVHFLPFIGALLIFLVILLTLLFPKKLLPLWIAGMGMLLGMAFHGILKYKDIKVFPFIPVVVPTQILGYGIGFGFAFLKRVVFGKEEFTGFVKNYYK
jgi:glycosyltransferase involved in cell wall biosynthesis